MTAMEFNYQLTGLSGKLKNYAYSLTLNVEDSHDLLQETFFKALKYRDKFIEPMNLKSWAYTIMKNTFINNYRRAVKSRTIIDSTKELYYINIPQNSGFSSPDSSYSANELRNGIEKLKKEFKVPFKMHIEGYKYKEIAEELNLPIGSVKSRIFFAREKLMSSLKEYKP
ncbi:MAG: RNA polymerase sigma factor [Bacteroidales bacterium]|nr:RNA polymerase sigma factor [Bacteroidales bacterium]